MPSERCPCCGHTTLSHMDEGGESAPCWDCIVTADDIRRRTWGAGPIRQWFHELLNWHTWCYSHCLQCGIRHP